MKTPQNKLIRQGGEYISHLVTKSVFPCDTRKGDRLGERGIFSKQGVGGVSLGLIYFQMKLCYLPIAAVTNYCKLCGLK